MCHIGSKNSLPRTFPSSCVTSGKPQPALHRPLWYIPIFLIYHIGSKIGLSRTFSSPCVTSGNESAKTTGLFGQHRSFGGRAPAEIALQRDGGGEGYATGGAASADVVQRQRGFQGKPKQRSHRPQHREGRMPLKGAVSAS